jgi:hypothetical protein
MSPGDVERLVTLSTKAKNEAISIINALLNKKTSREEYLKILHRIGNGNAVSRNEECLCLVSGMNKPCPYPQITNCISCEYEISTSSTMFWMASELNRLNNLRKNALDEKYREKYTAIIKTTILPAMDKILLFVQEEHGDEAYMAMVMLLETCVNE